MAAAGGAGVSALGSEDAAVPLAQVAALLNMEEDEFATLYTQIESLFATLDAKKVELIDTYTGLYGLSDEEAAAKVAQLETTGSVEDANSQEREYVDLCTPLREARRRIMVCLNAALNPGGGTGGALTGGGGSAPAPSPTTGASALPESLYRFDRVFTFKGSGAAPCIGHEAPINSADFSIAMWVRPAVRKYGMVAAKDRDSVGENQFRFEIHSSGCMSLAGLGTACGRPGPRPDSVDHNGYSTSLTTTKPLELREWTHVALTRKGRYYTIYLNGEVNVTETVAGDRAFHHSNALDLRIGSRYPPGHGLGAHNPFHGDIGDAVFAPECLSAEAVKYLSQQPVPSIASS